ncbi:MAG TPA: amidohydrolase family protein [Acidimicrobiales bacterium]|nr:amidohydrolase family protein [Acidimicrobiales bacterium]
MAQQAGPLEMYPPGGPGPPKDRSGHAEGTTSGLPAGTRVFSADNHISLSEDIFFERGPASMRDRLPRVVNQDDAWTMNVGDRPLLPREFAGVLMQYDPLPGSTTGDLETRLAQLETDGVSRELAFPNALLGLLGYPDLDARELSFRIYNEYLAELQERSNGRFYGVGLVNWWDAEGSARTLTELKSLGITTFWLPLKAGNNADGKAIDYNSRHMTPFWEAVEASGLPVSHHIGEGMISAPCAQNGYAVSMVHNAAPFREMFARYVCSGLLDRHKTLRVGWFEGGINWVPSAVQDAGHMYTSYHHTANVELEQSPQYYWDNHMYAAFMLDPLGLDMIDRIGRDRVMWSTDFPHIESTFGYSEKSLASVVDALGPDDAARVVSQNVLDYLGLPA